MKYLIVGSIIAVAAFLGSNMVTANNADGCSCSPCVCSPCECGK